MHRDRENRRVREECSSRAGRAGFWRGEDTHSTLMRSQRGRVSRPAWNWDGDDPPCALGEVLPLVTRLHLNPQLPGGASQAWRMESRRMEPLLPKRFCGKLHPLALAPQLAKMREKSAQFPPDTLFCHSAVHYRRCCFSKTQVLDLLILIYFFDRLVTK